MSRESRMRILHVTQYCHAGGIGGTERYVLELIRALRVAGHEGEIAWLTQRENRKPFEDSGVRIYPLPGTAMRVDSPPPDLARLGTELLDRERPNIVHFHTFGLAEASLAQLARQRHIPYVFTYHSPAWTCRRETMLVWGGDVLCDGEVKAWRCSACKSQERAGGSVWVAFAAVAFSAVFGWVGLAARPSCLRRRIAFLYETARYRRALRRFLAGCSVPIALNSLALRILERNGAGRGQVFLCRPGTPLESGADAARQNRPSLDQRNFTIGYVGRVCWAKGVHILAEAFTEANLDASELRICGWKDDESDYALAIKNLANRNPRIRLVPSAPLSGMIEEYGRLSLVAMPSICLDMAPLVLQEAWGAGVPVYGSSRIGQADELRLRGRVIEPNTPVAWRQALEEAFQKHKNGQWDQERSRAFGDGHARTMQDVAAEMLNNYEAVAIKRQRPG